MMLNNHLEIANDKYEFPYVLAIGNFDGLHLGHRALLEETVRQKKKLGAKSAILTFEPHPLTCLTGEPPAYLLDNEEKKAFAKRFFAIDEVFFVRFDQELAQLSPESFLVGALLSHLQVRHVVVGHNFNFGKKGAGSVGHLRAFCREHAIGLTVVPLVDSEYGVVSSTSIREHLASGDLAAANIMLGYWYNFAGEVIEGRRLGKTLGFPTANILPPSRRQLPKNGVYAVLTAHKSRIYPGIANLGLRPTVETKAERPLLEINLFTDQDIDLYGERVRVYFGSFIRPEIKFAAINELKKQVFLDIGTAKEFLENIAPYQYLPNKVK